MWNNYAYPRSTFFNSPQGYNFQSSPQFQPSVSSISPSYQQTSSGQVQNNIIWVKGKENARSMQLQPNSTLIMLDNQANKFYIKTTDDIGLGKIRVFNYTEEEDNEINNNNNNNQQNIPDLSQYVTKDQLQDIISSLKEKYNEQSVSTIKSKQPIIIKK